MRGEKDSGAAKVLSTRVPFGLSSTDLRLYAPREVPLGKACGCICPECSQPLYAKHVRSGKVVPHFAHAPGADCANGLETAVHLAAKQLIESERAVFLPKLEAILELQDAMENTHRRRELLAPEGVCSLSSVRLEEASAGFRPDLIAVPFRGGDICIEIAVTHFVDAEKLARIKKVSMPAVEFDLRAYREFTWDSLRKALLDGAAPVQWLFNPVVSTLRQKWFEELRPIFEEAKRQRQNEDELRRKEYEEARQNAEQRRQKYLAQQKIREAKDGKRRRDFMAVASRFKARSEEDKALLVAQGLKREMLPALLRASVAGDGSFGVRDPLVWQAALFGATIHDAISNAHWSVSKQHAISWLGHHFTVKPEFPEADKVAVWKYLTHLENLGAVRKGFQGRFSILVANLDALEALAAFRAGQVSPRNGLRWAEEGEWPSPEVSGAVARAHSKRETLVGSWAVVASLLSTVRQHPPNYVVERYSKMVEARHLVEYWISAGFLRHDKAQCETCSI